VTGPPRGALPGIARASFTHLAAAVALVTIGAAIVEHLFGNEPLAELFAVVSFALAFASAVLPDGLGAEGVARIFSKGLPRRR
jgi:hypothetical protein